MYVIVSLDDGRYFYNFDSEGICFNSDVNYAIGFSDYLDAKYMIFVLDRLCEGFLDSVKIDFVDD